MASNKRGAKTLYNWRMDIDIVWYRTSTNFPVGTVLVTHGYAEHHGRFMHIINGLTSHGFDVATYDHEGHGTSAGRRATVDIGHLILTHINMRKRIAAESRSENFFLFGHSMGGLITAASAIIDPTAVTGVVLSGPAFVPKPHVPHLLALVLQPLARVAPWLPTARMREGLLSHDPAVEEAFKADPLSYNGLVPLLTAVTMVSQGKKTLDNAAMLRVPMLILHGDEDQLTDPNGSVEFVRRVSEAHPNADISLQIISGSRHEILNEPSGEALIPLIVRWYAEHANPRTEA